MKEDRSIQVGGDVSNSNLVSGNSTNSFQSPSQQVEGQGDMRVVHGDHRERKTSYFTIGICLLAVFAFGGLAWSFVLGLNRGGQLSPNPVEQQGNP